MSTVFNEKIDRNLLQFEGDFEETIYKLYKDGISLEDVIIYHENSDYDEVDKKLIDSIKEFNINLNQPVLAHICNTCDFGDWRTVIMCKEFYLSIGYYSAGDDIASFSIYKWPVDEVEYFTEDLDFNDNMYEVISYSRDDN